MNTPRELSGKMRQLDTCPILLIGGAPRSGTTLLSKLFDGHPQAVVFPTELMVLAGLPFRSENERAEFVFDECFRGERQERMYVDEAYREARVRRKMNEMGQATVVDTDSDRFRAVYRETISQAGTFFNRLLRACAKAYFAASPTAQRISGDPAVIVFKTPYFVEYFAPRIAEDVPEARFLHILRHPIARFLSAKKRRLKTNRLGRCVASRINGVDFVTGSCEVTFSSQKMGMQNRSRFANYRLVHYEAFVRESEAFVREIAQLCEVEMHECLLTPTARGVATRPNTAYWREHVGNNGAAIDPHFADYRQNLGLLTSEDERIYLEHICRVGNVDPTYEFREIGPAAARRAWRRQMKFERPRDYLRRMLRNCPASQADDQLRRRLQERLPSLICAKGAEISGAT